MKLKETAIHGCFILYPEVYEDHRGNFMEAFNKVELERCIGYPIDFVQDNQSTSKKNVLRGLHYQAGEHAQAKLVMVVKGRALDVIVDLREESPTFGKHVSFELSEQDKATVFIPRGMAHGFLSLEDQTVFCYKCDGYYRPEFEAGIIYNDPDLGIDWGVEEKELILSQKDLQLPRFKDVYP